MQTQALERTTPYLRPNQVAEMEHDAKVQRDMLAAPPYLRQAVDSKLAVETLKRIETQLGRDAPKSYAPDELDRAVAREKELREEWTQGMPTHAEMRRNPPGALEKHLSWQARNQAKVDEWQNICLRLHRTGALPSEREGGAICNIEMFRPAGGPGELSLDNAQVPGKQFHFGVGGAATSVPMSDRELLLLQAFAPELYAKLATLNSAERTEVKDAVATLAKTESAESAAKRAAGQRKVRPGLVALNQARKQAFALGIDAKGSLAEVTARIAAHQTSEGAPPKE